jgi:hypothetical protein
MTRRMPISRARGSPLFTDKRTIEADAIPRDKFIITLSVSLPTAEYKQFKTGRITGRVKYITAIYNAMNSQIPGIFPICFVIWNL